MLIALSDTVHEANEYKASGAYLIDNGSIKEGREALDKYRELRDQAVMMAKKLKGMS